MSKFSFRKIMLSCGILLLSTFSFATSIVNLQTEYMKNPLGIDVSQPRFSWQMQSDAYGAAQTAYRVIVASSLNKLNQGDYVYDTGKVLSTTSVGVTYKGESLLPSTRYFWKVIVWDEKGKTIESSADWFETGLIYSDWSNAQWIGSSKYNLSKYRSTYYLDYDFQIAKKSNAAIFILGAKSAEEYVSFGVVFDKKSGAQLQVNRTMAGVEKKVFVQDISSVIPLSAKDAVHHVKVYVAGPKAYDLNFTIDGQNIKCPEASPLYEGKPDKGNAYLFRVENKPADETNPNSRLYQIGYFKTPEAAATFSHITITDNRWNTILYSNDGNQKYQGNDKIVLWQPGEDVSAPMLRKTIQIDKPIKQARLYATARGIYEFFINGKQVGYDFLNPGWTDYRYRIMYNTYDITSMLKQGANGLGTMIGEGWFSGVLGWGAVWGTQYGIHQSVLAKIDIEFEDGTKQTIVTDGTWKCYNKGPIESNDLYNGEDYNAQKEVAGWTEGNFDDSAWEAAAIEPSPSMTVQLQGYVGSPVQNNITLSAQTVKKVGKAYIYDMGQNMVGVPRLSHLIGKAGQQITVHYAEMLYPDVMPEKPVPPYTKEQYEKMKGQMYLDNYRSALSTDHYTFKGDAAGETFEPHFTSHGFRYISIEGLDEALPLASVQGIVTESIGKQGSSYETSNKDINKLFSNIVWGQRGNFLAVPTDCPQRDERLGWTGDAQIFSRAATYNMNVDPFYTRWFYTIRDDQAADGDFGGIYPALGIPPEGAGKKANSRSGGWSDVGVIVPWQVYQQYGDVGFLEQQYSSMSRYIDFLQRNATDYVQPTGGYGDWVAPVGTYRGLINTAYSAYVAQLMTKIATVLGKTDDAKRYSKFYDNIKAAFNKTFMNADGYSIDPTKNNAVLNTQTSYILPLYFGMFDGKTKDIAIKHFLETVKASNNKLTTGFLGTSYICLVLSQIGASDVAYKLFLQTEYPSWLFPVKQGATTIWERWNSYTVKNGFGPVGMNSFNHYSYGAIEEWMMSHSLGIQRDEQNVAYKHILLQPEIGEDLDYAKGGFESVYGKISSGWQKNAQGYVYSVTIPANTTASLSLVATGLKNVKVTKGNAGIVGAAKYVDGKACYELKSGSYEFSVAK